MEKTNHTGKYCRDCKIFTSECGQSARDQIKSILDDPVFSGAKIRILPDVHAGKGIVIGFTCKSGQLCQSRARWPGHRLWD